MPSAPIALVNAAAALVAAWQAKHPGLSPPGALAFVLSQMQNAEGSLSSYFAGTNNWGCMHATQSFARAHGTAAGYGMVAFRDSAPAPVGSYITRMAVYPSQALGARAMLDLVENMLPNLAANDETAYAAALYAHCYFEGLASGTTPCQPRSSRLALLASGEWTAGDQTNIAGYAAAIQSGTALCTDAISRVSEATADPTAVTVGPPFASLADRLTPAPSLAPHTIDHALVLLGNAAVDPPPGAISYADCQAAPGGDGVWMFPLPVAQVAAVSGQTVTPSQPLTPSSLGANIAAGLLTAAAVGAMSWVVERAWHSARHAA